MLNSHCLKNLSRHTSEVHTHFHLYPYASHSHTINLMILTPHRMYIFIEDISATQDTKNLAKKCKKSRWLSSPKNHSNLDKIFSTLGRTASPLRPILISQVPDLCLGWSKKNMRQFGSNLPPVHGNKVHSESYYSHMRTRGFLRGLTTTRKTYHKWNGQSFPHAMRIVLSFHLEGTLM